MLNLNTTIWSQIVIKLGKLQPLLYIRILVNAKICIWHWILGDPPEELDHECKN